MRVKKHRDTISVIGAREHNLKNISVDIPKNALVVITGPSGSGKSSLAMDVLYTEGKRRYTESLSSYARQFLGIAKKPNVDHITGLCPAIAIEQKSVGSNPRSTVGTVTEIYDYMRVLFARIGKSHCYRCKKAVTQESPESITALINHTFSGQTITIAAPIIREKKGEFVQLLTSHFNNGFYRFVIDGKTQIFNDSTDIQKLNLKKSRTHTIDLLIDHLLVSPEQATRIQEAVEKSFELAQAQVKISNQTGNEQAYSSHRMCLDCGISLDELEPRLFSFNSPLGACQSCHGLGITHQWPWGANDPDAWKSQYPDFFGKYATAQLCAQCQGKRLNPHALSVYIGGQNIDTIANLSIKDALLFFKKLSLPAHEHHIAERLLQEITNRLTFLHNVGLSYITLARSMRTLSGGEAQRIRLATQIGSALSGVLYVMDEPSIGLHQRDNARLIKTLKSLRDQGNTVIVVEHDMETIRAADHVIDMGPAAGIHGGSITATGAPRAIIKNNHSLTGAYLADKKVIPIPEKIRKPRCFMTLHKLTRNNLRAESVKFPLGVLCGISGVSGSGKSTLIIDELVPALEREFKLPYSSNTRAVYQNASESYLEGAQSLAGLVVIDQSPIGRTPRSNPATYLGIFDEIRTLFARLPESKARGYDAGRFSFNVPNGRCFECKGDGDVTVSMHLLPDVVTTCKSCKGKRYDKQTLEIRYKGKNIFDILQMTAQQALEFFNNHYALKKRLQLMCDVGLDYLTLGQPATTLSGGEAQRIKLVCELAKRGANTIYILDEPTTGLHSDDIAKLLAVLNSLVDKGNTVIVIEHNLDVLKCVDYLIDLGPEGGDAGGQVVIHGTPAHVAKCDKSHTAKYLKKYITNTTAY